MQHLVHRFHPDLGIAIALELHLRGAAVTLIQGDGVVPVPALLPHRVARTFGDYRRLVHEELMHGYAAAVLAAGVAEYQPEQVVHRLPSGQPHLALPLLPTAKINEEVLAAHPGLYLIPFHFEAEGSPAQLLAAATARLDQYPCVVESRGAEAIPAAVPWAWMVTREGEPQPLTSKRAVAEVIADHLEKVLGDEEPLTMTLVT
jgi:hypothetical protein